MDPKRKGSKISQKSLRLWENVGNDCRKMDGCIHQKKLLAAALLRRLIKAAQQFQSLAPTIGLSVKFAAVAVIWQCLAAHLRFSYPIAHSKTTNLAIQINMINIIWERFLAGAGGPLLPNSLFFELSPNRVSRHRTTVQMEIQCGTQTRSSQCFLRCAPPRLMHMRLLNAE